MQFVVYCGGCVPEVHVCLPRSRVGRHWGRVVAVGDAGASVKLRVAGGESGANRAVCPRALGLTRDMEREAGWQARAMPGCNRKGGAARQSGTSKTAGYMRVTAAKKHAPVPTG